MKQSLKQEIGFAQIKNEVLRDKNLSLKAKGLFAYIYSKPNNWNFSAERISLESRDGVDSVRGAIIELEENDYLSRKRLATGRVVYYVHFDNEPQNEPQLDNPIMGKSHNGKTQGVYNKDLIVTKSKEETSNPQKAESSENSEVRVISERNIQSSCSEKKPPKIAMSSVEKNNTPNINKKKLNAKEVEFFEVYHKAFKFTCSERTKSIIEGVPRILKLYQSYYGDNYLSKFKKSIDSIASDKYWQQTFRDNPLRVSPKNFFNQAFVENNLLGRVNKINTKQNGSICKTVLSEERRIQIAKDNARELAKLD